ncbi:hypothetical protein Mapa_013073 [Marchantia paleacea]|nr:hypothetical protein Mapa_013073 [Marchantia paleacea]
MKLICSPLPIPSPTSFSPPSSTLVVVDGAVVEVISSVGNTTHIHFSRLWGHGLHVNLIF